MEEVQKYDCIYNKYSKSYKDKYIKMNCWARIAEKFDMSAADAEKNIKHIRTGYGRYLKKLKSIPSRSSLLAAVFCVGPILPPHKRLLNRAGHAIPIV